ncbi:recombinase [Robinsoniella peoriensis]|uniref:recombinase n=1 Tax=Robinsoniella peoriensis TaxID=180332 RepID=UPI00363B375A
MGHTPFGYRIENGKAIVNEEQAAQIRTLYEGYLGGLALMEAAKAAGLKLYHGSAKRMMQNRHYLGDDYYPAIISQDIFDAAIDEQQKRAKVLGRVFEPKEAEATLPAMQFTIGRVTQKYEDPFKQAEYAYGLIESEVRENDTE